MGTTIKCALLIDDDRFTNFYNTKIVKRHEEFKDVIAVTSGQAGLNYLVEASKDLCAKPDLIFLDINMPVMNGWEFVLEYNKLDKTFTEDIKLVMLTTSNNPDDFERSKKISTVNNYINKPLSVGLLANLLGDHYNMKMAN
ncbi:hypothetical protein A8C32_04560 [Flavivirga aquatica]|uniref:Response regulatory domain-containing protein n=1 Tax=Flavivirga aquatica TaxID=1849968 RepID=A0A1E5SHA2_9FLAO|nr:response regulator [Flavivirga aquatica]OEJ98490.1 hypothetical protein A8C32_04560 [Flavivirga aquatica]